jgi:multidrug efflux pump subunit AcrA (membrane-fusion protein)
MYATAHLVLQEVADALVVPSSAVVRDGKKAACWIVRGGKAARVPIEIGLQVGNEVAVSSGLKGDEQVVQPPPSSLQEGQVVETTPAAK